MRNVVLSLILAAGLVAQQSGSSYDIVVYGGNAAAITAAVQAKRMGKTVVVVCPEKHLGGLTSGGLGFTDSGRKETIGGLSREFYHRVWRHYQEPDAWKMAKARRVRQQRSRHSRDRR